MKGPDSMAIDSFNTLILQPQRQAMPGVSRAQNSNISKKKTAQSADIAAVEPSPGTKKKKKINKKILLSILALIGLEAWWLVSEAKRRRLPNAQDSFDISPLETVLMTEPDIFGSQAAHLFEDIF